MYFLAKHSLIEIQYTFLCMLMEHKDIRHVYRAMNLRNRSPSFMACENIC